jgi:hypothetical protein
LVRMNWCERSNTPFARPRLCSPCSSHSAPTVAKAGPRRLAWSSRAARRRGSSAVGRPLRPASDTSVGLGPVRRAPDDRAARRALAAVLDPRRLEDLLMASRRRRAIARARRRPFAESRICSWPDGRTDTLIAGPRQLWLRFASQRFRNRPRQPDVRILRVGMSPYSWELPEPRQCRSCAGRLT